MAWNVCEPFLLLCEHSIWRIWHDLCFPFKWSELVVELSVDKYYYIPDRITKCFEFSIEIEWIRMIRSQTHSLRKPLTFYSFQSWCLRVECEWCSNAVCVQCAWHLHIAPPNGTQQQSGLHTSQPTEYPLFDRPFVRIILCFAAPSIDVHGECSNRMVDAMSDASYYIFQFFVVPHANIITSSVRRVNSPLHCYVNKSVDWNIKTYVIQRSALGAVDQLQYTIAFWSKNVHTPRAQSEYELIEKWWYDPFIHSTHRTAPKRRKEIVWKMLAHDTRDKPRGGKYTVCRSNQSVDRLPADAGHAK